MKNYSPLPPSVVSSSSRKVFIVVSVIIGLILLMGGIGYYFFSKQKTNYSVQETISPFPTFPPLPTLPPTPTVYISSLAPLGTTEYNMKRYRQAKASIKEAQEVQNLIGKTFGSLIIPPSTIFTQTEVYKGIPIKWTAGQPIPPDRLAWIKLAIDTLPEYFYVEHPATNIISASYEELGSQGSNPALSGAIAYASGLNIFLTSRFLKDSVLAVVDKRDAVSTILHEYAHVVQHYEVLQMFSEEYLSIPGNLLVVFKISPTIKEFAKTAGWKFEFDEYGDSSYAKLGTDGESQKTTEYGKTSYPEDMAESVASFFLCDTAQISQARIQWIEKTISKPASSFCPAKI